MLKIQCYNFRCYMAWAVHIMILSQNIDQIKPKFWFLSKSLFVELWNGRLIRQLIGVHPVGISAWEGARDEILGLWASFWLCFWVNHKEIQNSIFHGSLTGAWQPDLLLIVLFINLNLQEKEVWRSISKLFMKNKRISNT